MLSLKRLCAVVAVASIALTACSGGDIDAEQIQPRDPSLVAAGAELYPANCAECHGNNLRGTDKGPSLLSELYVPSHHADAAFVFAIQRGSRAHHWGFGDMPPVAGLNRQQIDAIVAYIRETQRTEGFEPYPP